MKMRLTIIFAILLTISSCGSDAIKAQRQRDDAVRHNLTWDHVEHAQKIVDGKEYYPEERNELVKLLNRGVVYYRAGDYQKSLDIFYQAENLSDKLYTTSIKSKAASLVSNDNFDIYYGANYERSYIRFYVALLNYHLYQSEQDASKSRRYLQNARAAILDWDSYLKTISYELQGRPTYKNDLTAKLFGAVIHKEMNTTSDLQIARILYDDGLLVLDRQYGSYACFNAAHASYVSNYKNLPKLSKAQLSLYIKDTDTKRDVISNITRDKAKLNPPKNGDQRVVIMINDQLIAQKQAKKFSVPIELTFAANVINQDHGEAMDIFTFAQYVLHASSKGKATIGFEYPVITAQAFAPQNFALERVGDRKQIIKPSLIAPLSSIAELESENTRIKDLGRISARFAAKHAAALSTAYATYLAMAKNQSPFALAAASVGYTALAASINESELADLRSWSTLPSNIYMLETALRPGKYKLYHGIRVIKEFEVTDNSKTLLVDAFSR